MELNKALYEEIIECANKILIEEKQKPEEERTEYNATEISKVLDNITFKSTRIRPTRKEIEKYLIMAINDKRIDIKEDSKRRQMVEGLKVQVDYSNIFKEEEKTEEEKTEEPKKKGSGFYTRNR